MKEFLKWLQGLGVGIASVAVAYFTEHGTTGPEGLDPTVSVIVVAVLTRLAGFLTSLLGPKPTTPPTPLR